MPKIAPKKPSKSRNHSSPPINLKTLIHDHSLFFDHLVDLIPARFYVPPPDLDDRPWFHGLSKSAKSSAKKQSRINTKKSRRARYDPTQSSSTLDLLKKTIHKDNKSIADENPNSESGSDVVSGDRSVTYEELRSRLHRRIEELRGNRNADESKENRKKNKRQNYAKRKRDEETEENKIDDDISYGKVKLGEKRKRMKYSKREKLEKAEKLEDAKRDLEKGKIVLEKHMWRAAISRAEGEKVHDDAKVLRNSLKKEEKMRQKSTEKWKERIEGQNRVREEKQRRRSENIRERMQQKKARRIEKREKKLMRPGFEGRKDGYIN